ALTPLPPVASPCPLRGCFARRGESPLDAPGPIRRCRRAGLFVQGSGPVPGPVRRAVDPVANLAAFPGPAKSGPTAGRVAGRLLPDICDRLAGGLAGAVGPAPGRGRERVPVGYRPGRG